MNYLLIIILLVVVWRVVSGYKKGMVKELQSFITFIVSSISIALICKAVTAYMNAEKLDMIVAVLLLIILGTCFKILSLIFFSAKAIVKLPVLHLADKVLGIIMGAAEVLFMVWALCLLVETFQTGLFAKMALAYINDNQCLAYLYDNNLLGKLFEQISEAISSVA